MALVDFRVDGHVAVVSLNSDDNCFNPPFLDAFVQVLDKIESDTEATAMVVYSTHEKIFSNGIDLAWLGPVLQKKDLGTSKSFIYKLNHVFKRLVTYPLITIAAISGHAFAGGAIFSCAFDFRFMRSDRGFFCLPEVDLGIPFFYGMNAILAKAIPRQTLLEMQLTGQRLTAQMCVDHQIVKGAFPLDQLMDESMNFARQLNKRRSIVAELKARLNRHIVEAIDIADVAVIESGVIQMD